MTHHRTRRAPLAAAATLLALLLLSAAAAAEPPAVNNAAEAMKAAREAYNEERYKDAADLYIRAAQLDPGARTLDGEPYRNLGRCLFWLEKFDQAAFWYQTYLRAFPDAKDHDRVEAEFKTANSRRADPDRKLGPWAVYNASLIELTRTLEQRLKQNAPALTADGGGTSRLFLLAVERGYALPDLADWAESLRKDLLTELDARFKRPDASPLPDLSEAAEPLAAAAERIQILRELAPPRKVLDRIATFQLLVNGFTALDNEQYEDAARAFETADPMSDLDFIPYAHAAALLRAGDPEGAAAAIDKALPTSAEPLRPWLRLLRAEALRARKDHTAAARTLLATLLQLPGEGTPVKIEPKDGDKGEGKVDVKTDARAKDEGDEPAPKPVRVLKGSTGKGEVKQEEGKKPDKDDKNKDP